MSTFNTLETLLCPIETSSLILDMGDTQATVRPHPTEPDFWCLTDIYRASGESHNKSPSKFLRNKKVDNTTIQSKEDRANIMWAPRETCLKYAAWLSKEFESIMIKSYDTSSSVQTKTEDGSEPVEIRMSHLEIAKIAGARTDNVKRTIERLTAMNVFLSPPMEERERIGKDGNKKGTDLVYMLDKRTSYIAMAQINPVFCGQLVDRWDELEKAMVQIENAGTIEEVHEVTTRVQFSNRLSHSLKGGNKIMPLMLDYADTCKDALEFLEGVERHSKGLTDKKFEKICKAIEATLSDKFDPNNMRTIAAKMEWKDRHGDRWKRAAKIRNTKKKK